MGKLAYVIKKRMALNRLLHLRYAAILKDDFRRVRDIKDAVNLITNQTYLEYIATTGKI